MKNNTMKIYKFTFIVIISSIFAISCGRSYWSENEKNNYLNACIKSYQNNSNVSASYASCYCNEALLLTMDKYATGEEADNNATMTVLKKLATKATLNANKNCK